MGVIGHSEDIQAPFVDVLQILRQQLLLVRLDPKPIAGAPRDARRVADLPHPADLSHHPTLLLLLLLLLALPSLPFSRLRNWTWKLQLILLVWRKMEIEETKKKTRNK